jgi:hypothetical protein
MQENRRPLALDGLETSLSVRRHNRAKRTTLRLDAKQGGFVLVLPKRASLRDGLAFAGENRGWMAARLRELPARVAFADGGLLPYHGVDHRIRHRPDHRGSVWLENGEIQVAGATAHLARRVTDWLRQAAKADLSRAAGRHADRLGVKIAGLSVRDTRSRWGSCSAAGRLSFCWRLVMAPEWVADYVAAHEVVHIAELNHSARFWRLVDELSPERKKAEYWLRRHGASLHLIG